MTWIFKTNLLGEYCFWTSFNSQNKTPWTITAYHVTREISHHPANQHFLLITNFSIRPDGLCFSLTRGDLNFPGPDLAWYWLRIRTSSNHQPHRSNKKGYQTIVAKIKELMKNVWHGIKVWLTAQFCWKPYLPIYWGKFILQKLKTK